MPKQSSLNPTPMNGTLFSTPLMGISGFCRLFSCKKNKEIACKALLSLITLAILLLTVSGPVSSATKMPAFKLENVMTGEMMDSKIFAGKSLLVIFFATWCPPCIQEIPNLIDLQNEYGKLKFSVVGLSVDQEGKEVVKKLVTRKDINYPVMMANKSVTRDFGEVYGIPTAFLVNNKGNVVKKYTGYVPHSVLVRDIKEIVN